MPVLNCEKYLTNSIDSILNQEFSDFEFLIIDDGSSDSSAEIIGHYDDPRIRFSQNEKNIGIPKTANKALDLAKGDYFVRMDCDDISHKDRLAKQVSFMDENPHIDVCGSWIKLLFKNKILIEKYPLTNEEIKADLFFRSSLANPTTIIRLSSLRKNNLKYDPKFIFAQDYDMWIRGSNFLKFANLPELLLSYRVLENSHYRKNVIKYPHLIKEIYKRNIKYLGIETSENELEIHWKAIRLTSIDNKLSEQYILDVKQWLEKLHEKNKVTNIYPEPYFSKQLANRWFWNCFKVKRIGIRAWKIYFQSSLCKLYKKPLLAKCKFLIAAILFQFFPKLETKK